MKEKKMHNTWGPNVLKKSVRVQKYNFGDFLVVQGSRSYFPIQGMEG